MRHEPRRAIRAQLPAVLIDAPQVAPKLMGADAFPGRAHQVNRQQPLMQRDVGVLKDRLHGHRERLAATGALVQALPRGFTVELVRLADQAAVRANRPVRPQEPFQMLPRRVLVLVPGCSDSGHDSLSR